MDRLQDASRLRDHWWSRPGWRPGRIMLTWHLTFEDATDLHAHVQPYQAALSQLPGLNLVPPQWLHLTIQGVGYTDETATATITDVTQAVRSTVSRLSTFTLTFGRPVIFGEAIAIRPEPSEPLQELLIAIRSGMASVLGSEAVPTGPEQADGFRPHVSIAYSSVDTSAEPYSAALTTVRKSPASIPVSSVALIRQERQLAPNWLYRWTTQASASVKSP